MSTLLDNPDHAEYALSATCAGLQMAYIQALTQVQQLRMDTHDSYQMVANSLATVEMHVY